MPKNRSGLFIGGLMLGATIGTLTGLLVAPRTGRETRKLLKKSANALPELAEDISSSVQIQADRLGTNALKNWDDTLDRLREAISAGMEARERETQMMKRQAAAQEGSVISNNVDDSQDAESTVEHLEHS
ncbi:MAG: YtxH domain-containing protein [Scytonematopsis contorta HA4267-MV1]|jgi:gas vesicle protein|nr:YtxH domain-containing protein [Scytonematopsis contorta HA4267-MV1]